MRQRSTVNAGDYMFFYGKGSKNHQLGTGFFVPHRIVVAVKRLDFISVQYHCFKCTCTN